MLLPRRSHGVSSISSSSAVPPSPRTHVHQPQAKRGKSFIKHSKKLFYPALMPSGGFQALTADTAESEFKVMGSFWSKKKKSFPFRSGVRRWVFRSQPVRLRGRRSGTPPADSAALRQLRTRGFGTPSWWAPGLPGREGAELPGAARGGKRWANNLSFTAEFTDKTSAIKCRSYVWGKSLSFGVVVVFFLAFKIVGLGVL